MKNMNANRTNAVRSARHNGNGTRSVRRWDSGVGMQAHNAYTIYTYTYAPEMTDLRHSAN